MCTGDVVSAAEETVAAIDGALATHEVPAPCIAILRDLREDLVSTLGETAPTPDEAAVARIVALRRAISGEVAGMELPGTSAAGSWLRLARAFAGRGRRALAADQPCAASAYLREVADLLLSIATVAEERVAAELASFAHLS